MSASDRTWLVLSFVSLVLGIASWFTASPAAIVGLSVPAIGLGVLVLWKTRTRKDGSR